MTTRASSRTPMRGWLVSEAISLTGTRVSMIALPWFVLTTTGSPTRTGAVALAEMLPLVVLKVLSGPVIDRIGARRVSIACDTASVAAVGAIPLMHEAGLLGFPLLLVLVALAGALRGPGDAAKAALTPAVVAEAGVPMERATGLHSTVDRTAGLVGAAAAAALVAALGAADALVVDALSFGLSAAVLAATTGRLPRVQSEEAGDATPYAARLRLGWDFLRRDRVLLGVTIMVALTNLLDAAYATVLVPVWSDEVVGSAGGVALVFAVFGGSAAAGALVAAAWAARLPRYRTYLIAFLVCGLPRFAAFGLGLPLGVVVAVIAVSGFAAGFINPVLSAVIFERIPEPLVGRVSALTTAMCFALIPFGGLLGGSLVAAAGLATAMLVAGLAYFVVTMAPAVDPRWREFDRRPEPVPVPA
ncbi:MFS transporter [Nocardioides mangrovi]|uniref:Multidrug efflux pump Tap n=1 Tax=Nocardioides mangrovi TaxID=2874580 RepID=A0ABS7UAK4_9ACTN|nr:MFS transporter [Nocardioides mangrovi]MBZ5738001.1 MFS transporter [Nocardioides mangrovi]